MMVLGEIGRMRTGEVALGDIKLFGLCRALSISLQMITPPSYHPGPPFLPSNESHCSYIRRTLESGKKKTDISFILAQPDMSLYLRRIDRCQLMRYLRPGGSRHSDGDYWAENTLFNSDEWKD